MKIKPVVKSLMAAIAVTVAVGCANTPSARLYVLSSEHPTASNETLPANLEGKLIAVARVTIPKHLDRVAIVTRRADVELAFSEFHRWGEPLANNLTDTMVSNLGYLLPGATVLNERIDHDADVQYRMQVEILRLTGELGKQAEIAARWTISSVADDTVLKMAVSRYRTDLGDDRHATYVAAVSRLVLDVCRDMANALEQP